MALHLVGETIHKTRAHYQAETGKLVHLMRGIYVDAADDIEATVLKQAVRIAKYLYPNCYLSAASAVLLGPTTDGRLFISGRRVQRTRLRSLEIILNKAPDKPGLGTAIVDDGFGEFHVDVSSVRQRFLEAFRIRSEHGASIDPAMRQAIAARLVEEFGTPQLAADAVWSLARENEWYREGEQAERFLLRRPGTEPAVRNEAALELAVAWHGSPIGTLGHDGFEWRWRADTGVSLPLIRETTPGRLPPFIESLLPEGWLETVLGARDERSSLRSGKRYMSNITIVEHRGDLATLPPDFLSARLDDFTTAGAFTGRYTGPGRQHLAHSFEENLARLFDRSETPRLSGVQIKAPMCLGDDGTLSPSTGLPFTHILKPAGTSGFEALPVVEWLALAIGQAVGFSTPANALVDMPDGMSPALLVERFDIRTSPQDHRLIALEDFCSVLGVPSNAKYDGTVERVGRALRLLSTSPADDLLVVLRRAVFAWLIADGDMHLKNLALLKIAEPGDTMFRTVTLAPLYDAVTTRVFPRLERDRMALKLNAKDDHLRRADFRALGSTAGIKAADVDNLIDGTMEAMKVAVDQISLPAIVTPNSPGEIAATRVRAIIRERLDSFD